MRSLACKRGMLVIVLCVCLAGLAPAIQKASQYVAAKDYVEVKGSSIAYVPRTAKFVKVNGNIKEVVRFAETLSATEEDCQCPACCDGYCYVIIFTDPFPSGGPIKVLYILWIKC